MGFLEDTFFARCNANGGNDFNCINDMRAVEDMVRSCEVDACTVVLWGTWFRDVLVKYYTSNNKVRMSGPKQKYKWTRQTFSVESTIADER
ncbi:unnamed protein product [Nippostrongylus brasiliensis]|uniref:PEROXIDASE_4 domain-containing protein n=1 Tax=Nippostrongylus brasiliensis TaxID=27835 RepID=A0A0N4YX56_NIPBR|nr:unnamed protein product [Nippostrongylus brasiliensis]